MKMVTNFLHDQIRQFKQKRAINAFDIAILLRLFATLNTCGIPIIQSCEVLETCQEKKALQHLLYSIKKEIMSGKTLFSALTQHPLHFDHFTCHLIHIGEQTGKLNIILNTLAKDKEKSLALRKKIIQALFYPCTLLISAIIMTFLMLLLVIPHFADLFQSSSTQLSLLTRIIFFTSLKIQHDGWLFFIAIALGTAFIFYYYGTAKIKKLFVNFLFYLPLIQSVLHKSLLTRFLINLKFALSARIPITEALKLASQGLTQPLFIKNIRELRIKIAAGLTLHEAMQTLPIFPPIAFRKV